MKKLLLAGALALSSTSANAATNLIKNGSFELPVVSGSCCNTVPPDPLAEWQAEPNVNVVKGTYASGDGSNLTFWGNQYLDLVGQGGTGAIQQSFSTVLGQSYLLSFYYSHNLFAQNIRAASADWSLVNLLDNSSLGTGTVTHSTGTNTNLDWRLFTFTFTGTGGDVLLRFVNTAGGPNEGIFLDNITVSAVPEPATWLTMLLGFGFIGYQMRRARRVKATLKLA